VTPQEMIANAMLDRNPQANRLGIPQQMGAFANSLGMIPTPEQEALQDPLIGPETYGLGRFGTAMPMLLGGLRSKFVTESELAELMRKETLDQLIASEAKRGGTGWTYAWPKPSGDSATIYRGLRGEAEGSKDILPGDWVTLDKSYAMRVAGNDPSKVLETSAPLDAIALASPITNEFRYVPKNKK
jgi:hypothetical protein